MKNIGGLVVSWEKNIGSDLNVITTTRGSEDASRISVNLWSKQILRKFSGYRVGFSGYLVVMSDIRLQRKHT
jgi:hypothetical protein